jgi:hypothetical protein
MRTQGITALKTLGVIRLINGVLGLVAPGFLVRRLGGEPAASGLANYPFRMFGIRTIVLACDLFVLRGEQLHRATQAAVLIHATDTASAVLGGVRKEVPPRTAVMTTLISAANTVLAVIALRSRVWQRR